VRYAVAMEREQDERFAAAVERKKAESAARSREPGPSTPADSAVDQDVQASRVETGRPQDTYSVRDKNSGKGKKTADKWNQ
jgi:hypothetical protein